MGYISKIPQFKKDLQRKRLAATNAIGVHVVGKAQNLCPVDSGRLRASIEYDADDEQVTIGTNVDYSLHVEKGTYKMQAQPYLTPAVEASKKDIADIVKRYMA